MISIYSIGHGGFAGLLSFSIDCTENDKLRTSEGVKRILDKLDKAHSKYPYIKIAYISCFENLSIIKQERLSSLLWSLRDNGMTIVGVTSPQIGQDWFRTLVDYRVVSGLTSDYASFPNYGVNEHLIDDSPEDGLIYIKSTKAFPIPNVYYNADKIRDFQAALAILRKYDNHRYGFFSFKTYKARIE